MNKLFFLLSGVLVLISCRYLFDQVRCGSDPDCSEGYFCDPSTGMCQAISDGGVDIGKGDTDSELQDGEITDDGQEDGDGGQEAGCPDSLCDGGLCNENGECVYITGVSPGFVFVPNTFSIDARRAFIRATLPLPINSSGFIKIQGGGVECTSAITPFNGALNYYSFEACPIGNEALADNSTAQIKICREANQCVDSGQTLTFLPYTFFGPEITHVNSNYIFLGSVMMQDEYYRLIYLTNTGILVNYGWKNTGMGDSSVIQLWTMPGLDYSRENVRKITASPFNGTDPNADSYQFFILTQDDQLRAGNGSRITFSLPEVVDFTVARVDDPYIYLLTTDRKLKYTKNPTVISTIYSFGGNPQKLWIRRFGDMTNYQYSLFIWEQNGAIFHYNDLPVSDEPPVKSMPEPFNEVQNLFLDSTGEKLYVWGEWSYGRVLAEYERNGAVFDFHSKTALYPEICPFNSSRLLPLVQSENNSRFFLLFNEQENPECKARCGIYQIDLPGTCQRVTHQTFEASVYNFGNYFPINDLSFIGFETAPFPMFAARHTLNSNFKITNSISSQIGLYLSSRRGTSAVGQLNAQPVELFNLLAGMPPNPDKQLLSLFTLDSLIYIATPDSEINVILSNYTITDILAYGDGISPDTHYLLALESVLPTGAGKLLNVTFSNGTSFVKDPEFIEIILPNIGLPPIPFNMCRQIIKPSASVSSQHAFVVCTSSLISLPDGIESVLFKVDLANLNEPGAVSQVNMGCPGFNGSFAGPVPPIGWDLENSLYVQKNFNLYRLDTSLPGHCEDLSLSLTADFEAIYVRPNQAVNLVDDVIYLAKTGSDNNFKLTVIQSSQISSLKVPGCPDYSGTPKVKAIYSPAADRNILFLATDCGFYKISLSPDFQYLSSYRVDHDFLASGKALGMFEDIQPGLPSTFYFMTPGSLVKYGQ